MNMTTLSWISCTYILLFLACVGAALARRQHGISMDGLTLKKTLIVDQSGHGDFTTVQAAIDYIPSNNSDNILVHIKPGIYHEKVLIPREKPFVTLRGEGMHTTRIEWNECLYEDQTPLNVLADNFVATGIGFVNTYNYPRRPIGVPRLPATAAKVSGDKAIFSRCGFFGLQDTLWDDHGRHYFKDCRVEGAVDFIYGAGQSIYEDCVVQVNADQLEFGLAGFITAQGRENRNDTNGFVFHRGTLNGTGSTYLGRAWRPYARVLFYQTHIYEDIVPLGWDCWTAYGREEQLTFAELDCDGPKYDTSGRVDWAIVNSTRRVSEMLSLAYIDTEGWTKPFSECQPPCTLQIND
ncbi:hypothetical protein Droror1_Dr00006959 [Drosera rotundifolia]